MKTLEERAQIIEKQLSEEAAEHVYETNKELYLTSEVGKINNNLPVTEEEISLKGLQNKFLRNQVEQGHSLTDISMDFAKAQVTNEIINSQTSDAKKYREDLAEEQKKTIKESFKQDNEREKTKTLQEKQKKAEAFYTAFRPILEFDFSNLIKNENKNDDKPPKTYTDRSYGMVLMLGMLLFLTIPYFLISIVLAVFNGVNAILEEVNTFGKVSRYIVLSIVIIFITMLLVYFILAGIEILFKVDIPWIG